MNRRTFLKHMGVIGAGLGLSPLGCLWKSGKPLNRKMIVLGIDGMDINIATHYMQKGLLPNFSKLAKNGSLRSVATSMPPQSPVAWSNFASGAPASVHGIYDFIHRDPQTMVPYLSTSKVVAPDNILSLGDYRFSLSGGGTEILRQGKPFWDYLAERDIPTTISRMPANFPCVNSRANMVSGMGTPDMLGGYGSFTYITTAKEASFGNITGGVVKTVEFRDGCAKTSLPGPPNTLVEGNPEMEIPVTICRDRDNSVIRLAIQDREFILQPGEWTDWIRVSFDAIPHLYDMTGICRVLLKKVHNEFAMYVSPINIDPGDPVLPIFSSESYGKELVENVGLFYTQGLPDDTKALSYGILDENEYLMLANHILGEQKKMLAYELEAFGRKSSGLLFFYVSSIDQNTHMYWRATDPSHPMYSEELHKACGDTLKKLYVEADQMLGSVFSQFDLSDPANTLIVMSDHGFAPFRRQVNLNTWLYENDFLSFRRSGADALESQGFFDNVDWSSTVAYNLGINALYLNVRGREEQGALEQNRARGLLAVLKNRLLNFKDPDTGEKLITDVRIVPEAEKKAHPYAPDCLIGWKTGYRCSWESILGGFCPETVRDNDDKWSGDHCIDPKWVPAILFTNRKVAKDNPTLYDITATILSEFGVPIPAQMTGAPLFAQG